MRFFKHPLRDHFTSQRTLRPSFQSERKAVPARSSPKAPKYTMKTENALQQAPVSNERVLAVPGKEKEQRRRAVNLQYTFRGSTAHFNVYYTDGGALAQSMADAVLGACERDYSNLVDCFGLTPNFLPFQIYIYPGSNGGMHAHCYVTLIHLDDDGMWHTTRNIDGSWQPFGNVKAQAGDPGSFVAVACTCANGSLHVCGVIGGNIKIWFATCAPDGVWSQFEGVTL